MFFCSSKDEIGFLNKKITKDYKKREEVFVYFLLKITIAPISTAIATNKSIISKPGEPLSPLSLIVLPVTFTEK